jgi:hypothetical protein
MGSKLHAIGCTGSRTAIKANDWAVPEFASGGDEEGWRDGDVEIEGVGAELEG